jgi:protein-tyrosine phosphatase
LSDVLFICTGNFYRSRFAEAVFNHHAEVERLSLRAVSRGLATHLVDGDISPHTQRALAERAIAMHRTSLSPTPLTVIDFTRAKQVIALDEAEHRPMIDARFPRFSSRVTFWSVQDLPNPPEVALPSIEQHVLALIASLRAA